MTWEELDWTALDRLRERFLEGPVADGPYWESDDALASYDLTYGERIGWKWDQVLRELRLRGWRPQSRHVLDWGCGSGIAARRVIGFYGTGQFDSLTVWDHSPLAAGYAARRAAAAFPSLRVLQAVPGMQEATESVGLLVVSHVLNELSDAARTALAGLAVRADEVLWVEPGSHAGSRQLGQEREWLRAAGFQVVAPCTHHGACPMLTEENARHWCHFFAPPPPAIFADSNWVRFGQRAGIDLRSLPYSFLALSRVGVPLADPPAAPAAPLARVIGRPEHFKPYARLLSCDASGLTALELPKRADPALFKDLQRRKEPLVYRWQRHGNTITGGESIPGLPTSA